jgi:hypothetical protein
VRARWPNTVAFLAKVSIRIEVTLSQWRSVIDIPNLSFHFGLFKLLFKTLTILSHAKYRPGAYSLFEFCRHVGTKYHLPCLI